MIFHIARPYAQALETQTILTEIGLKSYILSPAEVIYDVAQSGLFVDKIKSSDGLIFTSIHALKALENFSKNQFENFQGKIFVVGDKTYDAAKAIGFHNIFKADADNSTALSAYISEKFSGRLIYGAGKFRKPHIEEKLGQNLDVFELYEARARDAFDANELSHFSHSQENHILCFSQRMYEITFDLLKTSAETRHLSVIWHIISSDDTKNASLKNSDEHFFYASPHDLYHKLRHI
ncbi:MAG: uroporphyrinogen-III synthase [Pseudomonadota bacterium]